jgi:hypothetical protein
MARSDEYWLDLEDRKGRGDLRAYGLGDWLRIVFLFNVAQVALALVASVLLGAVGIAIGVGLGLGPHLGP